MTLLHAFSLPLTLMFLHHCLSHFHIIAEYHIFRHASHYITIAIIFSFNIRRDDAFHYRYLAGHAIELPPRRILAAESIGISALISVIFRRHARCAFITAQLSIFAFQKRYFHFTTYAFQVGFTASLCRLFTPRRFNTPMSRDWLGFFFSLHWLIFSFQNNEILNTTHE